MKRMPKFGNGHGNVSKLKDLLYKCLMFMGLLVFVEVKPLNKKFK